MSHAREQGAQGNRVPIELMRYLQWANPDLMAQAREQGAQGNRLPIELMRYLQWANPDLMAQAPEALRGAPNHTAYPSSAIANTATGIGNAQADDAIQVAHPTLGSDGVRNAKPSRDTGLKCFGILRDQFSSHDRLAELDHRIWRGRRDEPDRSFDGHPSWNEVVADYHAKYDWYIKTGISVDSTLDLEMAKHMHVLAHKGKFKEVMCGGSDCECHDVLIIQDVKVEDLPAIKRKAQGVRIPEMSPVAH